MNDERGQKHTGSNSVSASLTVSLYRLAVQEAKLDLAELEKLYSRPVDVR